MKASVLAWFTRKLRHSLNGPLLRLYENQRNKFSYASLAQDMSQGHNEVITSEAVPLCRKFPIH